MFFRLQALPEASLTSSVSSRFVCEPNSVRPPYSEQARTCVTASTVLLGREHLAVPLTCCSLFARQVWPAFERSENSVHLSCVPPPIKVSSLVFASFADSPGPVFPYSPSTRIVSFPPQLRTSQSTGSDESTHFLNSRYTPESSSF